MSFQRRPTPAYRMIQEHLLDRISSGILKFGDPVPSERELARMHGVSLMTARHALCALESAGYVVRRRGAGTFVAPPRIEFNQLSSLTEQMRARGLLMHSRVLDFQIVQDAPEAKSQLMVATDAPLVRIYRLRMGAGEPLVLETCYIPASRCKGLERATLKNGSLFSIISSTYGVALSYADEEVDVTTISTEHASLLKLIRNSPVLRIRQVIHSSDGTPIIYTLGLYRPDRHMLYVRRYR
jgi:GntR family transcriptional regulator